MGTCFSESHAFANLGTRSDKIILLTTGMNTKALLLYHNMFKFSPSTLQFAVCGIYPKHEVLNWLCAVSLQSNSAHCEHSLFSMCIFLILFKCT